MLLDAERLLFSSLLLELERLPGFGIPEPGVGIPEPLEARLRLLVEVLFLAALRFLLEAPASLDEGGAAILDPGTAFPGPVGETVLVLLLAILLDEDEDAELLAVGMPLWALLKLCPGGNSLSPEPFCKLGSLSSNAPFSFFKPNDDFFEDFLSSIPPTAPTSGGRALAP